MNGKVAVSVSLYIMPLLIQYTSCLQFITLHILSHLPRSDNTRLSHRISYLEEQVAELQASLTRPRRSSSPLSRPYPDTIVTTSQPGATVIQVRCI